MISLTLLRSSGPVRSILFYLMHNGLGISKRQLARETELSPSRISQLVKKGEQEAAKKRISCNRPFVNTGHFFTPGEWAQIEQIENNHEVVDRKDAAQ